MDGPFQGVVECPLVSGLGFMDLTPVPGWLEDDGGREVRGVTWEIDRNLYGTRGTGVSEVGTTRRSA